MLARQIYRSKHCISERMNNLRKPMSLYRYINILENYHIFKDTFNDVRFFEKRNLNLQTELIIFFFETLWLEISRK